MVVGVLPVRSHCLADPPRKTQFPLQLKDLKAN